MSSSLSAPHLSASSPAHSLRWVAVGVFILSSTLNYLDRNLLSTLAPLIMAEFAFNQTGFGFLLSAFSISYAAASLFVGWFLDRVGVNRGISAAVGWWSAAAVASGLTGGFRAFAICRVALGIGESAGVPAVGKLNGTYLQPEERALGAALNQVGLSLGQILAPLWIAVAYRYSWRTPFVIVGALGFVWIPLWWAVSSRIKPAFPEYPESRPRSSVRLLLDRNLILLVIANILWMGAYSLWSSWTTLYLTRVQGITLQQSAKYVWIPMLVSNAGAFFGGWLSKRWARRTGQPIPARCRAIWWSAAGMLLTLLLPFAHGPGWATAVISVSFFFNLSGSVNIYALPIDLYGAARSGLAISSLVFAFGILQTFISPVIGYLADHKLYTAVVWMVALPPVMSALVLTRIAGASQAEIAN